MLNQHEAEYIIDNGAVTEEVSSRIILPVGTEFYYNGYVCLVVEHDESNKQIICEIVR